MRWTVLPTNSQVVHDAEGTWVGTLRGPEVALQVVATHNAVDDDQQQQPKLKPENKWSSKVTW